MNEASVGHLVERLKRSRTARYLRCFVFLLLVAGGAMTSTGCGFGDFVEGFLAWCRFEGCSWYVPTFDPRVSLPNTVNMAAQGQHVQVWMELGATGVFTPTTTPTSILDELAEKGYIAIRVPHAPPTYTVSSLLPGIPPGQPNTVTFSYYTPPSTTTLTTVPVSVTRRIDYEAIVNTRFPIADGQSHWEVWWLPEGERLPIPDQPYRLDSDSRPHTVQLRFRIDFVDAQAHSCAGCPVEVLFYNGYVFIGPYSQAMRFTQHPIPREPLATFGVHCGYKTEALFPSFGQIISPTLPFTHTFCLENWDTVTRTFTISASSSQGWDYAYYLQAAEVGSMPVLVPDAPFTVTVGPFHDTWWPGMQGILAVHTPTIAFADTMRETLEIAATSVISPEVGANAVGFALAPGYQLNEGEIGFRVYLPLVLRQRP